MPIAQSNGGRDLAGRGDIEALLRRFYGKALHDDMLAEPFAEIRARGLESHLPVMCDFWETLLLRTGRYRRNALHAHQYVHHRVPLSADHFLRWLTLWDTTVDQMYRGPLAEHAKIQAARIAASLHRRLTGSHAPELEARAVSSASRLDGRCQGGSQATVAGAGRRRPPKQFPRGTRP
jgi:hemoglobin